MNRRNFLKSIATVCGAAVVCPGELVKSPAQSKPGWYDVLVFTEEQRKKYRQNIFAKARQQGCTNSTLHYFRGVPIVYRSPLYDETT